MKNKIEQFARNHWNDNLSIAWKGGGVGGFWLCHSKNLPEYSVDED